MRGTHGWAEVSRERKREIIEAIAANRPTRGPVHAELDLTDRCNVACYFCNQQDLRTKEAIPLPKLTDLIDELVEGGLKSVRLSGGGDPLFHRDVLNVFDYLAKKNVVVDNLTTNGVALNSDVAHRLVDNKAREVIFSLNAADAQDYARMMQVKPALFDKVLENIRNLIAIRGDSIFPSIVVQFLIDRTNLHRLVDMYELGRELAPDRVGINSVLEIPLDRIDHDVLLKKEDRDVAMPLIEEILRRDKERGLLQIDFAVAGWNEMLWVVRDRVGTPAHNAYPQAPAFKEENGGCFFAWYSAAITGNGDIRPCCLLLNPNVKPLGNIHDGQTFSQHWTGSAFTKLRNEMREVLLMKGKVPFTRKRFKSLEPQCVIEGLCWLKNMYFRDDGEFYAEVGVALDKMRKRELHGHRRAIVFIESHPRVKRMYDWGRESSRPFRAFLKKRLGVNLTDSV
ncbi:MAG TPA: radical SAM/SPASM domain-containing protein [Thermoanaerobaculia bacterium]|jgi:MoaA/NifB/PqqE/SkfB family radical SAM enzyme|nr:radical SAM/SPASM domain-containing protein [Thermoanaerobaculia bacterium]